MATSVFTDVFPSFTAAAAETAKTEKSKETESNNKRVYFFNEDGSCDKTTVIPDGFYTDNNGYFYSQDGVPLKGLHSINGEYYYFDMYGYAVKNCTIASVTFGDDYKGVTGLIEVDGVLCYYLNGRPKMAGLIEIDGDYYFAGGSNGEVIVDKSYYVWQGNGIIPESTREFDADGKLINGIVEKDGKLYYYEMGKPYAAGLVCVDGDYYFAGGANGELIVDRTYYVWKPNGIIPESDREFGPDGKMYDGIVDKDGTLCYYEMGQPKMAGLICVDGIYYFAHGRNGELATGKQYVWKTNDLMPEGNYEFDEDGKMLNGFVTRDGEIYYFVNGKPGRVGLNYVDGYYYFIDYYGLVLRNRKAYYVWETNGLSVKMNYNFDEYGRVII